MSSLISLSELLEIQNGFAFDSALFNDSTLGMPIIRIRDLARGFTETYYNGEYDKKYVVKKDDLLIGMDGEFRCYRWNGEDALLNQRVCRLQNFSEKVNSNYIYYLINKHLIEIENTTAFVTVKHISSRQINSIQIPLPPLPEQERIVRLLDEADALRKLRAQADTRMEEFVPALFYEMFGDFSRNNKWKIVSLTDVVEGKYGIKAGPFGSSIKKEIYKPFGYKVYGQEQVIADDFTIGDYFIDEEKFQELKACEVKSGDVLISLVGTFGKISVVPDGIQPGIINPRLLKITPNQKVMSSLFLKILLESNTIQTQLNHFAGGGTMGVLNAGILKRLTFPLPPLELQHEFAERVRQARQVQLTQAQSAERVEALYQSMLSRAFSGEL